MLQKVTVVTNFKPFVNVSNQGYFRYLRLACNLTPAIVLNSRFVAYHGNFITMFKFIFNVSFVDFLVWWIGSVFPEINL